MNNTRDQAAAHRVADEHYPMIGCSHCKNPGTTQVCHINGRRSDNRPNNLVRLCLDCHDRLDRGQISPRTIRRERTRHQIMRRKEIAAEHAALTHSLFRSARIRLQRRGGAQSHAKIVALRRVKKNSRRDFRTLLRAA